MKKAFIFSTSGWNSKQTGSLESKLVEKCFEVIGEFHCIGWDTFGPFALFGGMNKGRPNEEDVKKAKEFARSLKEKL